MNSFQLNDSTPYSIIYNQHNLITAHPTVNTLDRNAKKCNEIVDGGKVGHFLYKITS